MSNFYLQNNKDKNPFDIFKEKNRSQFAYVELEYNKNSYLSQINNAKKTFHEPEVGIYDIYKKPNKKTLTWRSPVVTSQETKSPPENFKHTIYLQKNNHERNQNESMESTESTSTLDYRGFSISTPRSFKKLNEKQKNHGNQFLLSDKDNCKDQNINSVNKKKLDESYSDICSSSLLDDLGIESNKKQINSIKDLHNATKYFAHLIVPRTETDEERKKPKKRPDEHNYIFTGKENIPKIGQSQETQTSNIRENTILPQTNSVSTCVQCSPQYTHHSHSTEANIMDFEDEEFHQLTLHNQNNYDTYMHDQSNSNFNDENQHEVYWYPSTHNNRECINRNYVEPIRPTYEHYSFNTYSNNYLPKKYCEPNCVCFRSSQPTPYHSPILAPSQCLNPTCKNIRTDSRRYNINMNTEVNYSPHRNLNSSFYRENSVSGLSKCTTNNEQMQTSKWTNHSIPQVRINNFPSQSNPKDSFYENQSMKHHSICHSNISQTDDTTRERGKNDLQPHFGQRTHPINRFVNPTNPLIYNTLGRPCSYNTHQNCSEMCNCPREITNLTFENPYDTIMYPCNSNRSPYFQQTQYNSHNTNLLPHFPYNESPYIPPSDKDYVMNKFFKSL